MAVDVRPRKSKSIVAVSKGLVGVEALSSKKSAVVPKIYIRALKAYFDSHTMRRYINRASFRFRHLGTSARDTYNVRAPH